MSKQKIHPLRMHIQIRFDSGTRPSAQEKTPKGLDMFFFSNSGAEAIEGAIKLCRFVTKRPAIIAFTGGFHGRTLGALS